MALTTLRPATSPRLSVIRLEPVGTPNANQPIETVTKGAGNDLRRIADELARV